MRRWERRGITTTPGEDNSGAELSPSDVAVIPRRSPPLVLAPTVRAYPYSRWCS